MGCLCLPLGLLFARSVRPRPWFHVPAIVRDLHSSPVAQDESSLDIWAPARWFFELPKARPADLDAAGAWHGWNKQLDFGIVDSGALIAPTFSCSLRFLSHLLTADARL